MGRVWRGDGMACGGYGEGVGRVWRHERAAMRHTRQVLSRAALACALKMPKAAGRRGGAQLCVCVCVCLIVCAAPCASNSWVAPT